jgi:chromosome segregation ATPase
MELRLREHIDARVAPLEQRLGSIEQRLDSLESRLDSLERRVVKLAEDVAALSLRTTANEKNLLEMEQRILESARIQFQQLSGLYRALLERFDRAEKHNEQQFQSVRGAIEALRVSIETQDFRTTELGRRVTVLETRDPQG